MRTIFCLTLLLVCNAKATLAQLPVNASPKEPLRQWVDLDTGHRIVRLSDEGGSSTLYFHDTAYTPEGDKFIFNTPSGLATVDVAKIGTPEQKNQIVVTGGQRAIMARRSREVYTSRGARGGRGGGQIFAVNVDTKAERLIPNAVSAIISADEAWGFVVANGAVDPTGATPRPPIRELKPQLERMFPGKKLEDLTPDQQYSVNKEDGLARRAINPEPAAYTFINLKTGERKTVGYQFGSLNHQQWNPVIPDLLLYAHEGTWHEVDRTWNIRADGSGMKLMHTRTMDMEINGHEWWSYDGKTVWFDLQTPRSQDFWLAGVNIETMKETRYHLNRDTWGVHFNSSRDDALFMSDGGDASQVSYSPNGKWINLFRVQPDGSLAHERLVHMYQHNYVSGRGGVEPNGSITPDNRWVIFTGQFEGDRSVRHVYAVEIGKSK